MKTYQKIKNKNSTKQKNKYFFFKFCKFAKIETTEMQQSTELNNKLNKLEQAGLQVSKVAGAR